MATDSWKHVRIYVASGYFDMEGERQHLANVVLPKLRQQCILFRTQVHFVDLRVGLNENDWNELIAKKGCAALLEEIDRCRPFFVGFYGHKYGVPLNDYKIPREPKWSKLLATFPPGRSVLELETYWAALHDPLSCKGTFYFRDGAFMRTPKFQTDAPLFCAAEITPPITSKFPERKTDMSIGNTFLSVTPNERQLMESLKATVQRACGDEACMTYTCEYRGPVMQLPVVGALDAMGEHLVGRVVKEIAAMFSQVTSGVDGLDIEQAYHKAVLDQHLQYRLVGRDTELQEAVSYATDTNDDGEAEFDTAPLVVHGRPGAGVSCLLANAIDVLRDRKELRGGLLLYHFVGASPSSTNIRLVLYRACRAICRAMDFTLAVPDDYAALVRVFDLLIAECYNARRRRLVMVLDGMDRLDPEYHGETLNWVPVRSKARVILGMHTDSVSHHAIDRRHDGRLRSVVAGDLSARAGSALLSEYLSQLHKAVSVAQAGMLLDKLEGKRPLYLMLAAGAVAAFGRERVSLSLEGAVDDYVAALSPTTVGLCRQTVAQWEAEYPEEVYGSLVTDVTCFLACARHGLQESELLSLCPRRDPRTFPGCRIDHPPVPLPRLMLAHLLTDIEPYLRSTPRWMMRSLQLRDYALLRAVQKQNFPDSPRAAALWVRLHSFAVARARAADMARAGGGADSVELAANAMRNATSRNAEEGFHARLARYFRERELQAGRASWSGRYPRALLELPYHLTMARLWSVLQDTLLDLRFIEGKFRQRMGHDLIQDFVLAVQSKAPEAARLRRWDDSQKLIQDMHRFVSQNFETLLVQAAHTFQLAANLPGHAALAARALEQWRSGEIRQPWVRWLNRPADVDPLIHAMRGHTAPVNKVSFSSDGLRVLTAGEDCTVRQWDAFSGELVSAIPAHLLPVLSVRFVPGSGGGGTVRGRVASSDWRAVSASRDKMLKLWDLQATREVKRYTGHIGRVLCVAVKVLVDWDMSTGQSVIRSFAATGSWDRSCKVWDLDSGEVIHELGGGAGSNTCPNSAGHANSVTDAAFSPDGSVLVTGSEDETVRLWNLVTGEEIKKLEGHDNAITSVDYSSDGSLVLSASEDGTLKLWDTGSDTGRAKSFFDKQSQAWVRVRTEVVTFVGCEGRVLEGRLSVDMQRMVAASSDATVRIFPAAVSDAMAEQRRRGVAVEVPASVVLRGHAGAVRSVAISPDSWRVASAGDDGVVRIWDLGGTGTPAREGHGSACVGVCYGPFGEVLLSCGHDGALRRWDGREGLAAGDVVRREEQLLAVAVSPDGVRAAVVSDDGVLRGYDLAHKEAVITQRHSYKPCRAVCFTNGRGFNLATGADDGTVRFWSADTGELNGSLDAHVTPPPANGPARRGTGQAIHWLVYHRDNYHLASASDDRTVRLWQRRQGKDAGRQAAAAAAAAAGAGGDGGPGREESAAERRERRVERLTERRRNEKVSEMGNEERLARQKRKELERKRREASREERYAAGEDVETGSSDEDSLLGTEDMALIQRLADEPETQAVGEQSEAVGAQQWGPLAVLKGHTGPVTAAAYAYGAYGQRCVSCVCFPCVQRRAPDSEQSTKCGWK